MTSQFTDIDEANRRIDKLLSVIEMSNNINRRMLEENTVLKFNNEQMQENLRAAQYRLNNRIYDDVSLREDLVALLKEALAKSYGNGWIHKPDDYTAEETLADAVLELFYVRPNNEKD